MNYLMVWTIIKIIANCLHRHAVIGSIRTESCYIYFTFIEFLNLPSTLKIRFGTFSTTSQWFFVTFIETMSYSIANLGGI